MDERVWLAYVESPRAAITWFRVGNSKGVDGVEKDAVLAPLDQERDDLVESGNLNAYLGHTGLGELESFLDGRRRLEDGEESVEIRLVDFLEGAWTGGGGDGERRGVATDRDAGRADPTIALLAD